MKMDDEFLRIAKARLGLDLAQEATAFEMFRPVVESISSSRAADGFEAPRGVGRMFEWFDSNIPAIKQWLNKLELSSAEKARLKEVHARHRARVNEFLQNPDVAELKVTLAMLGDLDVLVMPLQSKVDSEAAAGVTELRRLASSLVGKQAIEAVGILADAATDERINAALSKVETAIK